MTLLHGSRDGLLLGALTANIIATDMAQLLPLLQDNINLNQAGDKITAEVLSWCAWTASE